MKTGLHAYINAANFKKISKKLFCRINLFSLLATILLFGSLNIKAQNISNPTMTGIPVCAGSTVTVNFNVTNGAGTSNHYINGTSYQAYISDASGANFVTLGSTFNFASVSYNSSDGGSTTGLVQVLTIPVNALSGVGYKISIGSTSPVFNGSLGTFASAAFQINAPTVTIVSDAPGNAICTGGSINFSISTSTNGGSSPTYQWQKNGLNIPNANNAIFNPTTNNPIVTIANNDVISLVFTPSAPCTGAFPATSNFISVIVNAIPTITGTTDNSRCGTGTVVLSATASAGVVNWYAASTGGASLDRKSVV